MNNTALPYWLTFLVLIGVSYGGWKLWQVEQYEQAKSSGGLEYKGPPLEEFELAERSGKTFRSEEMRGKVWVVSMFFSTCPGSCKKLNANIKALHDQEDLQDVTWVSISVDPNTDTLPVLREYADSLKADPERWLFCRGELKYVKQIGQDFLKLPVFFKDHNDYGVVIDKNGQPRGSYDINKFSEHPRLIKLIKKCLAEEMSPESNKTEEEAVGTEENADVEESEDAMAVKEVA